MTLPGIDAVGFGVAGGAGGVCRVVRMRLRAVILAFWLYTESGGFFGESEDLFAAGGIYFASRIFRERLKVSLCRYDFYVVA